MYAGNRYQSDKIDYEAAGVAPPSVQYHEELEPINVDTQWKQKGNYIYREGQDIRCASKIPTNVILMGTDDDGKPIFKKLD